MTPSPSPEPLLHTSRDSSSVIKHDEALQKTLNIYDTFENIGSIYIKSFMKGVITEAHSQNILMRNLQAVQEAITSRLKRDSLAETIAAKSDVIKTSECKALSLIRAQKKEGKTKRAKKRKDNERRRP